MVSFEQEDKLNREDNNDRGDRYDRHPRQDRGDRPERVDTPPLFSSRIDTDRRTYFFDMKETREGSKYVVISESRRSGDGFRRDRVMVFEENMDNFLDKLEEVLEQMKAKVSAS